MATIRNARERARAEITAEIADHAREQLREVGAAGLSLRAVARDLGLASSAVYRYFPNRDALLTTLITDAYDALGSAVEQAEENADAGLRDRWRACAHAARDWAHTHPHEYALIYGTPVPDFRAPDDTIRAASRAAGVLARIVADGNGAAPEPVPALDAQLARVAAAVAPDADHGQLALAVLAWTQLFGIISFELFGQYARTLDPADAFFAYALDAIADGAGLP